MAELTVEDLLLCGVDTELLTRLTSTARGGGPGGGGGGGQGEAERAPPSFKFKYTAGGGSSGGAEPSPRAAKHAGEGGEEGGEEGHVGGGAEGGGAGVALKAVLTPSGLLKLLAAVGAPGQGRVGQQVAPLCAQGRTRPTRPGGQPAAQCFVFVMPAS